MNINHQFPVPHQFPCTTPITLHHTNFPAPHQFPSPHQFPCTTPISLHHTNFPAPHQFPCTTPISYQISTTNFRYHTNFPAPHQFPCTTPISLHHTNFPAPHQFPFVSLRIYTVGLWLKIRPPLTITCQDDRFYCQSNAILIPSTRLTFNCRTCLRTHTHTHTHTHASGFA